jgi:hypothetical protein
LNDDPFNVLAEELAMEHCKQGHDITQELSEMDMVITSCGNHIPGTPDGGFIDAQGLLRLVQVVRVPLLPGMDADEVAQTLYDTVLVKIVKSQEWMRQTGTLPHDFTIFCWLPPVGAYEACLEQTEALLWTEALIWNVRSGGWPFTLTVEVPAEPGGLFPAFFGTSHHGKKNHLDEVSHFLDVSEFENDDADEDQQWDLFDLDFENDGVISGDIVEDMPSRIQTLLALAIQVIEEAAAEQHRAGLAPDFIFFINDAEEDCTFINHQVFRAYYVLPRDAVPKKHEPRERDGKPAIIQGLPRREDCTKSLHISASCQNLWY